MTGNLPAPLPSGVAPAQPPTQQAFDATRALLLVRLRNLRRFAAGSVALLALPPLAALFGGPWWLWAWAGLPLLGFAYFRRDRALVDGWENQVLDLWAGSDMYLSVVVTTLNLQPGPLKASVQDLLALLPAESKGRPEDAAGKSRHRALAALRQAKEGARALRAFALYLGLAGPALAASLAAAGAFDAAVAAAVAAPLLAAAFWGLARARLSPRLRGRLEEIRRLAAWDADSLRTSVGEKEWAGLPRSWRAGLEGKAAA